MRSLELDFPMPNRKSSSNHLLGYLCRLVELLAAAKLIIFFHQLLSNDSELENVIREIPQRGLAELDQSKQPTFQMVNFLPVVQSQ